MLKPGYKTTEFGTTVGGIIAALLVTFGVITTSQIPDASKLITDSVVGIGALLTIGHLVITYVQGRNELKSLQKTSVTPTP